MSTNNARFTVSLPAEMLQQVEDYRYSRRIPTRSFATIELIRKGLEAVAHEDEILKAQREKELREATATSEE